MEKIREKEAVERLQHRLSNGETWLRTRHAELLNMERIGIGSRQEGEFLAGLEMWDSLDFTLRFAFPEYQGCALGEGRRCSDTCPISCRYCGRGHETKGKEGE